MPGNVIDIYLQHFIRKLKELRCDGANTYNSFKHEMFKMYVALMWTISNYPGLKDLSVWNIYTGCACVHYNYMTPTLVICLIVGNGGSWAIGTFLIVAINSEWTRSDLTKSKSYTILRDYYLTEKCFNKLTTSISYSVGQWIININGKTSAMQVLIEIRHNNGRKKAYTLSSHIGNIIYCITI